MEVQRFTDPEEFWVLAEPVVVAEPVLHSVLASVVDTVRRQPTADGEFWAVSRPGRSPFLALHTPPYPLHLPTDDPAGARAVAEAAHAAGSRPGGANGQTGSANTFADRWGELTGRRPSRPRSA
jgi:hypothetical protein